MARKFVIEKFILVVVLMFVQACVTTVKHGVLLTEEDFNVIIPNFTRKEDVKNLLGSPSFVVNNDWYYVATTKEYRAFFLPKTTKHNVFIVKFENETVAKINYLTEKDIVKTPVPLEKIKTKKPNLKKLYNAI